MPVGIEAWVFQIPPITRTWLALSVLTSIAVVSKLVLLVILVFTTELEPEAMSTYNPSATIL